MFHPPLQVVLVDGQAVGGQPTCDPQMTQVVGHRAFQRPGATGIPAGGDVTAGSLRRPGFHGVPEPSPRRARPEPRPLVTRTVPLGECSVESTTQDRHPGVSAWQAGRAPGRRTVPLLFPGVTLHAGRRHSDPGTRVAGEGRRDPQDTRRMEATVRSQPYADRPARRLLQLGVDLALVGWTVLWVQGGAVRRRQRHLPEQGRLHPGVGRPRARFPLTEAGRDAGGVPLLGDRLSTPLVVSRTGIGGPRRHRPRSWATGRHPTGTVLGLVVASVPILSLALVWAGVAVPVRPPCRRHLGPVHHRRRSAAVGVAGDGRPKPLRRITGVAGTDPVGAWVLGESGDGARLAALEADRWGVSAPFPGAPVRPGNRPARRPHIVRDGDSQYRGCSGQGVSAGRRSRHPRVCPTAAARIPTTAARVVDLPGRGTPVGPGPTGIPADGASPFPHRVGGAVPPVAPGVISRARYTRTASFIPPG
jgi:hypothetical protein